MIDDDVNDPICCENSASKAFPGVSQGRIIFIIVEYMHIIYTTHQGHLTWQTVLQNSYAEPASCLANSA